MEYIQKELPAMNFVGVGTDTTVQTCSADCPIIWSTLMSKYNEIENAINPQKMYGVSFTINEQECSFRYIACVEVGSSDESMAGFEKVEVPSANYFIFTHKGSLDTLGGTYGQIMEELKKVGKIQDNFWIELYDERYKANSSESEFDILIPVK